MTLRSRLFVGLAVTLAVVAIAAMFIVRSQRDQLYGQIDDQLRSVPLPADLLDAENPNDGGSGGNGGGGTGGDDRDGSRPDTGRGEGRRDEPTAALQDSLRGGVRRAQASDLYVAAILDDGSPGEVVHGALLDDVPELAQFARGSVKEGSLRTVDGASGAQRFRVLLRSDTVLPVVVAVPIDHVDDTVNRLTATLLAVTLSIAFVLGVLAWWVSRHGLRPIAEMTATAEALSSGDLDERATAYPARTEAGRLSIAFNSMLDRRDEDDERLRRFVSDASHELRTPLTSVRGFVDLYQQGAFVGRDELNDAMRRIGVEASRMTLLVEDLLLLARLGEEPELELRPCDLQQVVADVVASAAAAHPGRSIDVTSIDPTEVDADGGGGSTIVVDADRPRIHQAIAGLLDNALTHTTDTSRVQVGASATSDGGARVVVADDGPGISAEDAPHVFDRFYRGDRSRSRRAGGTGLGLAIVHAIVDAHGGEVRLASSPGEGAVFVIDLPAGPSADSHS